MDQYARAWPFRQRGLSLIELMVALLIAGLVSLGMLQIFGASRTTYQMQEGLSRVQESGRYAVQYLQRQLRMVGYMGCGADTERSTQASFVNHMALYNAAVAGGDTVDSKYRFQRPIEAFAAADLPDEVKALAVDVVAGTDVLVLRTVSEESVPVVSVARSADKYSLDIIVAPEAATVFASANENAVAYALQNCRSADVFVGTLAGATSKVSVIGNTGLNVYLDPTVKDCGTTGCPWDFRISNAFLNAPINQAGVSASGSRQLNAEIHRAEYTLVYIRKNPNGIPSLYTRQFKRAGTDLDDAQELAEGIENLQVRFGVDTNGDGQIDAYETAADVATGGSDIALDANWRNVLSVRIGMLIRSPDRAAVSGTVDGEPRTYQVLGKTITPADDGAMRQVYETTIALRNRLYNS